MATIWGKYESQYKKTWNYENIMKKEICGHNLRKIWKPILEDVEIWKKKKDQIDEVDYVDRCENSDNRIGNPHCQH